MTERLNWTELNSSKEVVICTCEIGPKYWQFSFSLVGPSYLEPWITEVKQNLRHHLGPGFSTLTVHQNYLRRNSLVVQWLGHCVSIAWDPASVPGLGTKISQATGQPKGKKKKKHCLRSLKKYPWADPNSLPPISHPSISTGLTWGTASISVCVKLYKIWNSPF